MPTKMVWVIRPIATLAIRVMSVMSFSFFWTVRRLHAHYLCAAKKIQTQAPQSRLQFMQSRNAISLT
jgi:hypothetical protein